MASLGDIIEVVAQMVIGVDVTILNVFHARVDEAGGVSDEDVVDDLGEWMDGVYDNIDSNMEENVDFDLITYKNISAEVDLGASGWPTLTSGGYVGERLPEGVAGLSLARTGAPRHAGRKYWGGFGEGHVADGLWGPSVLANMAAAASDAYTPFTSSNGYEYTPVVVDRTTGEGREPNTLVTTNVPAYQRRRRPGTGI